MDTTQTLRYYTEVEVPESPGWTLVTYEDGIMVGEDILDDDRAAQLHAAGVPMDDDTHPVPRLDLVAVEEAARIAGVSSAAIHKAHSRGTMPPPVPVAGTDVLVWERTSIESWAAGRRGPGRPRQAD